MQIDLDRNGDVYELSCAKMRDGKYYDGLKYEMRDVGEYRHDHDCTEKIVFALLAENIPNRVIEMRTKVIKALGEKTLTFNKLYVAIGKGDRDSFSQAIADCMKDDAIRMTEGPNRSHNYSLTENGKEELEANNV
jgi:hypothetical protein